MNPKSDIPHPISPIRNPISDIRNPISKVLIVDDEESIRTTLRVFLQNEGYNVEVAEDVPVALELLAQGRFDVVVSDIVLPRVTGVELLKQLRETAPDIHVIMMTGEPTLETAVAAVRAGADDYLTKPVGKAAILRTVATAARMKQLEDAKRRLESENLEYQKNLEQKVDQRTHELRDAMTRLKAAQEQMIRQERLNALGQMASGIAHDFNNALMPILGFSEMLLSDQKMLDDREGTLNLLRMIEAAGEDARHIVQRLREIYKEEEVDYQLVDLAKVVETSLALTTPKWKAEMNARGATVEMVTKFAKAPLIKGDVNELREALTNLIFNAVDAMPGGGTITLLLNAGRGRSVVLEVSDTGGGMDESALRHCIEPFFTTKGKQGTGLGLSMVNGIVQRHGGVMEIESKPGEGTTIRMRFPVPVEIEGVAEPELEPEVLDPMRVLIVDDDARSRNLILRILQADGHDVTAAGGGPEGLTMFGEKEFDLVITNRAMPLMSGDDVAGEISRIREGMPVIMLTGFGDAMNDAGELPAGVTRLMTKPITSRDLKRVMASVMNGQSP